MFRDVVTSRSLSTDELQVGTYQTVDYGRIFCVTSWEDKALDQRTLRVTYILHQHTVAGEKFKFAYVVKSNYSLH